MWWNGARRGEKGSNPVCENPTKVFLPARSLDACEFVAAG